jgi:hypothetical protein
MSWIILWFVLSVPVTLFIGAFMAANNRRRMDSESKSKSTDYMLHDQTIVG